MSSFAARMSARAVGVLAATAGLLGLCAVALAGSAAAAPTVGCTPTAGATTCEFAYTGAEQSFTVPAGISSVHVLAQGGIGDGPVGGGGALVEADLTVTPGDTLYVEVGGSGQDGGFNGGGAGTVSNGGGGASDIRTKPASDADTLDSRLLVAAGGGGTGRFDAVAGCFGFGSGGSAGVDGGDGTACNFTPATGGGAGGADAGGSAGTPRGTAGSKGLGGAGGDSRAGGGGGGLYGGGGGGASGRSGFDLSCGCSTAETGGGGGGGGSNLVPDGGSSRINRAATFVTITYDLDPPTVSLSADHAVGASGWFNASILGGQGQPLGLTASADDAGGSGVASIDCTIDGGPVQSSATSPFTLPSLSDGTHNVSCTATDNARNTSKPVTETYKIDTVNPAVTFSDCPTGAITTGAAVTVNWSATDAAPSSGVITAIAGGAILNTSALGAGSVSSGPVSDRAGNTANASCNYTVGYNILGFFAPVPKSKWKPGHTVPIKIALANSAGTRVQACSACRVTFQGTKVGTTGQAVGPTPMKYDPTTKQYQYNWKLATKGTGLTNLIVTLTYPDGSKTGSPPVPIVIGT